MSRRDKIVSILNWNHLWKSNDTLFHHHYQTKIWLPVQCLVLDPDVILYVVLFSIFMESGREETLHTSCFQQEKDTQHLKQLHKAMAVVVWGITVSVQAKPIFRRSSLAYIPHPVHCCAHIILLDLTFKYVRPPQPFNIPWSLYKFFIVLQWNFTKDNNIDGNEIDPVCDNNIPYHDDVIKWRHFPRNWPFVRGIHRSRWIPHTKASDAELWCFLWSAPEWTVE